MEKLLSPKKLGKLLGVATATLANNRSTGIGIQIPYIKSPVELFDTKNLM